MVDNNAEPGILPSAVLPDVRRMPCSLGVDDNARWPRGLDPTSPCQRFLKFDPV